MRAGIRQKVRGSWKLEGRAERRREYAGHLEGEKLDFLGSGNGLGRLLFLFLTLLDRFAHVARMLPVEGFFCTGEDGSVLRGVGPDHVCPGYGLEDAPVSTDDKKQRNSGDNLAAGCEEFSTKRGHERGDWIPRGVKSN